MAREFIQRCGQVEFYSKFTLQYAPDGIWPRMKSASKPAARPVETVGPRCDPAARRGGGASMTELMWIRSHVEVLLQREWDVCRVVPDADGDYPFRRGT